ncbi:acetyltransferase family protein [Clostridium argentinense CDC 2741]|uniref:Acetyltransferase family protein n=1 Tax=Clostridium argentinense CDC 2741 TaxID=1418104 RepID=A0A0C1TUK1_9CLOT|nr:GNAT family N-acetyltransferase [Clostridium argentinense]ARC83771.1 N-acetyltransferase [Clostridium argentinense]KIE44439.1 acetyltransferase family protein [Clostridium argentinense CDC 2741]NFF39677.1 GNAT family N-acetyltransferase [Clostridium argentinense]NFP49677.1 GNAT family N-acetyltransferase [Clostridium argentinense]NFP72078.1 GNAT family N-acetyltransferase [Clostridium argentinense]
MLNIRRAKVDEYEMLTDIAIKSEAYWGYDSNYMDKFKSIYNVSEEFIKNNSTVLIEEDNSIVGFYGLICKDNEISLEYFFIEPKYIGKGYGKLLWNYLVSDCKNLGIKDFDIVTSPQAKEFYVKMGAIPCGEVESLLKKGRIIPQLIYKVEK